MLLQMASVRLPHADAGLELRLFDEHRIEIPVMGDLLRISIAAYTTRVLSPRAGASPRAR
jgi:hypothetical protein